MGRKRDVEKQNFKHKPASRASKRQQDPNSFKVKRINKNLKNTISNNYESLGKSDNKQCIKLESINFSSCFPKGICHYLINVIYF